MAKSEFLPYIEEYRAGYSKHTIEAHIHWITTFVLFHNKQHPSKLNDGYIEAWLTHLALDRKIAVQTQKQPLNLAHFVGNPREPMPQGLPFHLNDYIELVEWSGRILREDKRGHISKQLPPILLRLGIPSDTWMQLTKTFESQFSHFVGDPARLRTATAKLGFQRSPGLSRCKAAFS